MSFRRPPDPAVIAVAAIGGAEGAHGAAAALACAAADADRAALFVDLGGRPPRPTLIASVAARELEGRLKSHLPGAMVAARGQTCHIAAPVDPDGLEGAAAAATVARPGPVVVHVPVAELRGLLDAERAPRPTAVLLRADLPADRSQLALLVDELARRELTVRILKRRLGWIAERRALFGVLPAGSAGGLPERLVRRLLAAERVRELA